MQQSEENTHNFHKQFKGTHKLAHQPEAKKRRKLTCDPFERNYE